PVGTETLQSGARGIPDVPARSADARSIHAEGAIEKWLRLGLEPVGGDRAGLPIQMVDAQPGAQHRLGTLGWLRRRGTEPMRSVSWADIRRATDGARCASDCGGAT